MEHEYGLDNLDNLDNLYNSDKSNNHNERHVVVIIPHDANLHVRDSRIHVLFISLAIFGLHNPHYHIYLIGKDLEIITIVALIYIQASRLTELTTINKILQNENIRDVLYLEYGMFLNNHQACIDLYIPKETLKNCNINVPYIEPLIPSDKPILRMESQLVADIYIHDRPFSHKIINSITKGDQVFISCVLVINSYDKNELRRFFQCYENQTHTNKELIIVASSKLSNILDDKYRIFWTENESLPEMWNIGVQKCTGDYILRLTSYNWYHHSLLSILADRALSNDYISLSHIIGYKSGKFIISDHSFQGWEQIVMISRSKFCPILDVVEWKSVYMQKQWDLCDSFYILGPEYAVLYVDMKYHSSGSKLSDSLYEFFESILDVSSHLS